jgi:hypothetical protein
MDISNKVVDVPSTLNNVERKKKNVKILDILNIDTPNVQKKQINKSTKQGISKKKF